MTLRELINVIGFQIDEPAMRKVEAQTSAMFEKMKTFGEKMSMRVTAPITGAAAYAVNAFGEYNAALAIVKLRLAGAGDAAQFTVEQLDAMSASDTAGTLYEADDVLKDVSGSLLMFGNISADVFGRAQKMSIDLAAAMDVDLKSATLNLGKALEDPANNFEALARIAKVKFTPEQKTALETMQRVNGTAKAQAYILDILEKRHITGTAKALAGASSGFKMFMLQVKETAQGFGKYLFPVFQKFWGILSDGMKRVNDLSPETKKVILIIAGIAAAIPLVVGALGSLGLAIGAITTGFGVFSAALSGPVLLAAFAKFGIFALVLAAIAIALLVIDDAMAGPGKKSVIGEVMEELSLWTGVLADKINNSRIVQQLADFGDALNGIDDAFRKMEFSAFENIGNFFSNVGKKMSTTIETIKTTLSGFGEWLATYLKKTPLVGNIFGAIGGFFEGANTPGNQRPEALPPGFLEPSPATVAGAQGSQVNVTVNQTLPAGTPEAQAQILKVSTEDLFKQYMSQALRGTLANFSVVP